jgi:ATP/maltotriose-dependent transcriptional regulator MalT
MNYARLAGDDRIIARNVAGLCSSTLLGPTPVTEAIAFCRRLLADGLTDRQAESRALCTLAQLHAMNGDFEEARLLYRRGRGLLRELGKGVFAAGTGIDLLIIESMAGDLAGAEREAMPDYDFLQKAGDTYQLSTIAALLSRVIRDQGRDEEAMKFSEVAERLTAPDDVDSQALWRSIRAPILARAGQYDEALSLAHFSVELFQQSDAPQLLADALAELASVLVLAEHVNEARQTLDESISLYTRKGDVVSSARAKARAKQLASPKPS